MDIRPTLGPTHNPNRTTVGDNDRRESGSVTRRGTGPTGPEFRAKLPILAKSRDRGPIGSG